MKKLLLLTTVLALVGCDQQSNTTTTFPPPQVVGHGKALMFEGQDKFGQDIINESMSTYFREHQDEQFMGLLAVEHVNVNGNPKPSKYIVFSKELSPQPTPPPTTLPVVGEKGEITYPQ